MDIIKKYKNYLVLLFIAILGYIGYTIFYGPDRQEQEDLLKSTNTRDVDVLGEEIIRAINQIESLTLDQEIFDDPVLNSLVDLSQDIDPEDVGRRNPFEPIDEALLKGESSDDGTEIPIESLEGDDEDSIEETEPQL